MTIGLDIAQARRRKAMTQREFAAQCGCTITAISMIECGQRLPREYRILLGVADILGLTIEAAYQRIQDEKADRAKSGKAS